ncbi:hypothetical protein H072_9387 [Dactylellina haptotyla CBS 200.50]|uniref:Uncharacterized protein n=1 Tax=Dactylellina haptotyla (strain CBS 200.50) TaxID=1284197 RepID=S8A212_DACHA|nr:hypothetical protein H072_9387 [Dactylellina haptotyla CBS 200.50]
MEVYIRTGAQLYASKIDIDRPDGKCFPIHTHCWRVFGVLVGGIKPQIQDGRLLKAHDLFPVSKLNILVELCEEFMGWASWVSWPHNKGWNTTLDTYWSNLDLPQDYEGRKDLELSPRSIMDHHTISATGRVFRKLRFPGLDLMKKDLSCTVPDVLPLPVELTWQVLSFLPGSSIHGFSLWGWPRRVKVPDSIWKEQFDRRGELGHIRHRVKYLEGVSYYRTFLAVASILGWGDSSATVANYRRIWDSSMMIMDTLSDIEKCQIFTGDTLKKDKSVEEIGAENGAGMSSSWKISINGPKLVWHDDKRRFRFTAPAHPDPSNYYHLGEFKATGILVSYIGSNSMRFVSGLTFLPGKQTLGRINPSDQVYSNLMSKTAQEEQLVLWAGATTDGFAHIMVAAADEKPSWEAGDLNISKVPIMATSSGIDITRVRIGTGVYILKLLEIDL